MKLCEKKSLNKSAMIVVIILIILIVLSTLGFAMYDFFKSEKHLLARIQYSGVAEKLAQAAAKEALVHLKYGVLNFKNLDKKDPFNEFILAPITDISEKKLQSRSFKLPSAGHPLFTAEFIKEAGGTLNYVEFKYEQFKAYNKSQAAPSDYNRGGYMPPDPFERFGRAVISSSVSYRGINKIFTYKYDIKIANTLAPVLSKFTLFAKKRAGDENQLPPHPLAAGKYKEIASHGFIDPKASPGRTPLVLIHHPQDIFSRDGYAQTYSDIREILPDDDSVKPGGGDHYRPSMTRRGWVFLADGDKKSFYRLNISPGSANPLIWIDYPPGMDHLRFPEAFLMLESNLSALLSKLKSSKFPYGDSFRNAQPPPGANDFAISINHEGVYWNLTSLINSGILKNYTAIDKNLTPNASLLKLSGDVQAVKIDPAQWYKPSRYLDRRSPTIVLGNVFRSYIKTGYITQNCVHETASPFYSEHMKNPAMHKQPYGMCPGHIYPGVRLLPYFFINENGTLMDNGLIPSFFDETWNGLSVVDDTFGLSGQARFKDPDFALIKYDINDIFACKDAAGQPDPIALKTYKLFMSRIVSEPYNKSHDWIIANSRPEGGVIEPGPKYMLRQKDIKILSAYPDSESDDQFFYTRDGKFGGCLKGAGLKISQYRNAGKEIEQCQDIFQDGIYAGNLEELKLTDPSYQNPIKNKKAPPPNGYDIRMKADAIFDNLEKFAAHAMSFASANRGVIKYGGIFYIDSDSLCDMGFINGSKLADIVFSQNTMLIFKKDVKIPSIYKSDFARSNNCTLTIVSTEGDVIISGRQVEASLNAPGGAIKKSGIDYFQVFGNLTMSILDFDPASNDNIFKVSSTPSGLETVLGASGGEKSFVRMSVLYDPALDVCDSENYFAHYGYTMSRAITYWSSANE